MLSLSPQNVGILLPADIPAPVSNRIFFLSLSFLPASKAEHLTGACSEISFMVSNFDPLPYKASPIFSASDDIALPKAS